MPLTPAQVSIVRSTVPILQQHGTAITTSFYSTLLAEHPPLNNIFNQANQRNNHQAQALAGALYAYASHIDDLGALTPAVEKICQKHASLYIQPDQYEVVGTYLLRAMGDVLGAALTEEVLEAWRTAYWQLANIMIVREEQILSKVDGWTDWREFSIADKVKESEEITSFYLKPTDGRPLPTFLPGQYISILTDVPKFGYLQSRQYSLSDAPRADYYRVSVKKEEGVDGTHPGYVSNVLHDNKSVGDSLKVSHPAGEFYLDPASDTNGPVVLLSAGVGLTPMISILNTLVERNSQQQISFVHGSRRTATHAFRQHIKDVVSTHPNVTASIFIKTPNTQADVEGVDYKHASRVKLALLDKKEHLYLHDAQTLYFVCGPEGFMASMHTGLRRAGVPAERIRMEAFGTGSITVTTAPGVDEQV
ncbi:Nitric oxide oxidoreductase [Elasticomyces elasticus]|nr:Nitric oxide oxidoreductase [Elasticomyces elasticus]